jgi:FtsH-binding integral membrane protein
MSYSAIDANRDVEAGTVDTPKYGMPLDEADEIIRNGFVRKVFGILTAQLTVTAVVIAIFNSIDSVKKYVSLEEGGEGHTWPLVTSMFVSFGCIITLACCADMARSYPHNYIFLSLFTLAESVMLGVVCTTFEAEVVLLAVGITAAVVLGLVGYAMNTKRDFTGAGPYLWTALWALLLYGVVISFFPYYRTVDTAYSLMGVFVFSFYLVYDIQLVVGGRHHRFKFGVDDYIFAALNVYLDIINLFLRILQLLSKDR